MFSVVTNNGGVEKRNEVKKAVAEKFKHTSPMQTTDIVKIVLNSGVGQAAVNPQLLENTVAILAKISGQKPVTTKARHSITGFKLREGMLIGCKVTLRRKRVGDFLFGLVNINLPLVTNFRGLSDKFGKDGNYNLGLNDLSIFPYAPYDLMFRNQGMQITIVFKSSSVEENRHFLSLLDFPFVKKS